MGKAVAGDDIRWPILTCKCCLAFSLTRFILSCPSSFLCYEITVYFHSRLGEWSGIPSVKTDPACIDKYFPLFEQFFFLCHLEVFDSGLLLVI